MKALRRAWSRLAGSFPGRRREADLADELASHIEMLTEANVRRGMTPEEARRAARIAFGSLEAAKERCRDQRGIPALDAFWHDVRYALRGMRRNPVFAGVTIACLALGIGANTAIFSLFNAVMLRSLPVSHPEELVFFRHNYQHADAHALRRISSGYGAFALPYPTYEAIRDHARTLDGVFVFVSSGADENGLTVDIGGRAVTSDGEMVTGSYFAVLGVAPILGRGIAESDLAPGAPDVAVISYDFWQRELGAENTAIGSSVVVNGIPFIIVGVAPPRFTGLKGEVPDFWIPLRVWPTLKPWNSRAASTNAIFSDRHYWWCTIGARVRPGVTRAQVQAEVESLFRQSITAGLSEVPPQLPGLIVSDAGPVFESLRRKLTAPLRILLVTAALVLLIACANVATLLIARAKARQKEIGVRLAIGASRARVVRQLLTESLLLSLCGGALGWWIAQWGATALLTLLVGERQDTPLNVAPDLTVLAFTAAVSITTGVLFGLFPALRAARADLAPQLAETATSTTPRRGSARLLVASQIALSAVLLFGAGLFVRTFRNLDGQKLGFNRDNLLLFDVDPERSGYRGDAAKALLAQIAAHIAEVPGVQSATLSQVALLSGSHNSSPTATDGPPLPPGQPNEDFYNRVGAGFFETMGMRVLFGRGIEARDTASSRAVAVVNESWARAHFPGESPVGHIVSPGQDRIDPEKSYEIIGLVEDAKYDAMRTVPPRTVYLSYNTSWDRPRRMCFAVRSAAAPATLVPPLRAAVAEVAPNLPLFNVRTQRQQIQNSLGEERMLARISSFFGALALLLAAIGIYGTLSYAVTQRTGEIGIRMALGAGRPGVLWMVLRESLLVAVAGLAVGLPAALALSRFAESSLFGVSSSDGVTLAATVVVLCAMATISGLLPANRAARIDPLRALRHE